MQEKLVDARIVAIFRGDYRNEWLAYAQALLDGGVTAMEITLNSADALNGIALLAEQLGDQIILGAGTVLTADEVHQAVDAGATFIVAPDTDEAVIVAAKERGAAVIPGAYTPSEIKRAFQLGADMVKVFPAQTPAYIKAVRAPLNHIPLMATGGVNIENAAAFIEAGARSLGLGSALLAPSLSPDAVQVRAQGVIAAMKGLQLA
jgi:2-dehydro-3-deoxyphosphogluconate aldolase/(4S)-4-hydroxy-2-oxoglutarate aldolase